MPRFDRDIFRISKNDKQSLSLNISVKNVNKIKSLFLIM